MDDVETYLAAVITEMGSHYQKLEPMGVSSSIQKQFQSLPNIALDLTWDKVGYSISFFWVCVCVRERERDCMSIET